MRKSKGQIISELQDSFKALSDTCKMVNEETFNQSRDGKWTPAENFQHLVSSTKMTSLAFTLPKFMHVMLYGKPRRTSHGFSKVISNYTEKLEQGAQASGVYVPRKTNYNKTDLTSRLHIEGNKLVAAIENKWSDEQLDNYQISHPVLGLLTVRELAYFTIYHNGHHLETVKRYYL